MFNRPAEYDKLNKKLAPFSASMIVNTKSIDLADLLIECNKAITNMQAHRNGSINDLNPILIFLNDCALESSNITIRLAAIGVEKSTLSFLQNNPALPQSLNKNKEEVELADSTNLNLHSQLNAAIERPLKKLNDDITRTINEGVINPLVEEWGNRKMDKMEKLNHTNPVINLLANTGKIFKQATSSMSVQDEKNKFNDFKNKFLVSQDPGFKLLASLFSFINIEAQPLIAKNNDPNWTFFKMVGDKLLIYLGVNDPVLSEHQQGNMLLLLNSTTPTASDSYVNRYVLFRNLEVYFNHLYLETNNATPSVDQKNYK